MARILVVDDEEALRHLIVATLEKAGHTGIEAANGREAMRRLGKDAVDLIITDILMPERDGIEMLMSLKRDRVDVPVIAMSGINVDNALYLKVAQNLGARRTLEKPFALETLVSVVNEVLEKPRAKG